MPHHRRHYGFTALLLTGLLSATPIVAVAHAGTPTPEGQSTAATDPLARKIAELERNEEYLDAFSLSVEQLDRVLAATPEDTPALIDALAQAQVLAVRCGRWTLAEEVQRIIVDMCRAASGDGDPRLVTALTRYGGIARLTRGYPAAWQAMEEARCILESAGETRGEPFANLLMAQANWHRWGNREQSVENITRALTIYARSGPTPSDATASCALWLGWMYLHMGDHDAARKYIGGAGMELKTLGLGESSSMGTVLAAQADLAAIAGDWAEAEGLYREATRLFEISRVKRGLTGRDTPLHGYNLLALMQAKQGKSDAAWLSLQRYRGQLSRAALSLASREAHGGGQASLDRLSEQLLASRASGRALAESPDISAETWRALVKELRLTAEYARAETDHILAHPVRDPDLGELKASLGPHTAYMGWLDARIGNDLGVSKGRILYAHQAYVVRPGREIEWVPVWDCDADADENTFRLRIKRYMTAVHRAAAWRQRVTDDPALRALSAELYPLTIGSALSDAGDVTELVVEFTSLDAWSQTDGLVDANGHYLGERFAISFSPSAAVYLTLRERARDQNAGAPEILAVGDPIFSVDASYPVSGRVDQTLLRAALDRDMAALERLPRLPSAAVELDRIGSLFPASRVVRGVEATEQCLTRMAKSGELADFDIVHVASHALVDPAPDRCAIALSRVSVDADVPSNDGLLEAREIRHGWLVDADLVVLSGCQTAGTDAWLRGEPVGFVQDLFAAGARCVMVSRWKVDDLATSMLMSRFYENLAMERDGRSGAGRVSFAAALGEAKNWLREYQDENGDLPFAHPVYWSGFILVGDAN